MSVMDSYDVLAGMKRRREAAHRMEPLHCGCRDPWTCRCHDAPPSEKMLDAYAEAAEYLVNIGLTPGPNIPAMHRMWRRGGNGLRLAVRIAKCWGLAA